MSLLGESCIGEVIKELAMLKIVDVVQSGSRICIMGLLPKISENFRHDDYH